MFVININENSIQGAMAGIAKKAVFQKKVLFPSRPLQKLMV